MKKSLKAKLRLRFVLLTLLSLFLIQSVIVGLCIYQNLQDLVTKSDMLIAQLHHKPSASSRYFSVKIPAGKDTVYPDAVQNVSITAKDAADLARRALETDGEKGFLDGYRYRIYQNGNGTKIYFLHRASAIEMCKAATRNMIGVSLVSLLAVGMALIPLSSWIVKPLVDNHNKQKQFITAAGHQLKTPLTVISTNAQLLESEIGQSPWLDGILKQTEHLSQMTGDLVLLSKAEEYENPTERSRFSFSDALQETLESFEPLTKQKQIQIEYTAKKLIYSGSKRELQQLFCTLLDNACKYCPEQGRIRIEAEKCFRGVRLLITNTAHFAQTEDARNLTRRFHRGQNAAGQSGFGLGLSIAEAIATRHNGTLNLSADKDEFRTEVILR